MKLRDYLVAGDKMVSIRWNKKNYLCNATEAVMVFGNLVVDADYINKIGMRQIRVSKGGKK